MRRIDRGLFIGLLLLALAVSACGSRSPEPVTQAATEAVATVVPTASLPPQPAASPTPARDAESPLPEPTTAGDAQSPLPAPTETAVATPTLEMVTFSDAYAGFAIDHPADWTVLDPPVDVKESALIYSVTLQSWPLEEPGTHGIPEGGSKMDITIGKSSAATVEDALESYRRDLAQSELPVEVVSAEAVTLAGGLAGTMFELKSEQGEPYTSLVTSINGHRIMLSGLGDQGLFEVIAATLRALPAEETP